MLMRLTSRNSVGKAIVFALTISVFTSLRFSFLGIGELIFVVLGGVALIQLWDMRGYNKFVFSKFWLLYIILAIIGFLYNKAVGLNTGTVFGAIFDLMAYFMLLISCLAMERRFVLFEDNAYKYVRLLFFSLLLILTVLYGLSLVTNSIAGLPLRYYQYFAPLVKNLHQVAMMLTPLPFIGLLLIGNEKKFGIKFLIVIFILMSLVMIMETGASKAKLGVILGSVGYLIATIYRYKPIVAYILATIVGCLLLVLSSFFVDFNDQVVGLFNEHDGHGGRALIYSIAITLIQESWIFGRGSGAHIYLLGEFNDAHQTFLTIILQTGVLGIIIFVRLLFTILNRSFFDNPAVFGAVLSIMAYAGGGDILRRLPIWGVLIILFYVAKQSNMTKRDVQ